MHFRTILIGLVLLCTACGPRYFYPHLDWLIPWYVDDYISLNSNQNSLLKKRLQQKLDWHCRTQLPEYAQTFRELAASLRDDPARMDSAALSAYYETFTGYWRNLAMRIAPDAAEILATASDDQIAELFDSLEEQNRKLYQEYVEPPIEIRLQNRGKRMIERLKPWLRKLTSEQAQAVVEWSARLEPITEKWWQHRQAVQARFRRMLEQRRQVFFRERLVDMVVYPERFRSPDYQTALETNTRLTLNFLARLNRKLTPTQRSAMTRRIESFADDFDRLSCDPAEKTGQRFR